MKLFVKEQIKSAEQKTCEVQSITERDLIQRAAVAFVETLQNIGEDLSGRILIFAGPGNNGSDGISIAKNLYSKFLEVELVLIPLTKPYSDAFSFYMENPTDQQPFPVHIIKDPKQLKDLEEADLYIDAILGTGFNKEPDKLLNAVFDYINSSGKKVISVDIPSGLGADSLNITNAIKADKTISFEFPKLSFFDPLSYDYTGDWTVTPIRLDEEWKVNEVSPYNWITKEDVKGIIKKRNRFSHKGDYGHSFIISGSYGKIGASILAGKACLKTGAGLLTMHLPKCGYEIMQISIPEAMVDIDQHQYFISEVILKENFNAVGIGPGIGIQQHTEKMLQDILESKPKVPMVLDADALNTLAKHKDLLKLLPENTILTPHPREFDRLFGLENTHSGIIEKLIKVAKQYKVFIVFKGGYTMIATPEGDCYFNNTGNPGMATAGSGDVLTGILIGLLSQAYSPLEACIAGVFLHGSAGDIAVQKSESQESMLASDIIANLGAAFKKIAHT